MTETNHISIVIPIYNENESLVQLLNEINILFNDKKLPEIIFIDDGSSDGSTEILKKIAIDNSHVKLIIFKKNYGKSIALNEGFNLASRDFVITMDGDLQDDPKEIFSLIEKLNQGYDMVSGWKKNRKDPISKRFPSKIFNFVLRMVTGLKIHDFNCGLKAYKKHVLNTISLYGGLHRYIPALAKQNGYTCAEIIVNHRARQFGTTKYGGSRFLRGFFDLFTVMFLGKYFNRPLHFFGKIALLFFSAGFAISFYLTIGWIQGVWINNRPLFFLGILLIIIGIQFFSIGLLGELFVKVDSTNKTPNMDIIDNVN